MTSRLYLGCAVWGHKEWIGELFPAGSKSADLLRLYADRLTTVEGNTTFYATPNPDVVARWADQTPESFRFCLKLPREISHDGPLAATFDATAAFAARMVGLGERLGPFFLQLPPSFSPRQLGDLTAWLDFWRQHIRRPIAVEVRHIDWYRQSGEDALMRSLADRGVARVLMDVRPLDLGDLPGAEEDMQRARDNKPDVPLHLLRSGDIALVRYIGHPDVPRNAPLLDEWAATVKDWIADGTTVYFFMHCPIERHSPELCRMLQRRLEGTPGVPPLPWDSADAGFVQETLF